ncbi:MAG: outer membrane beta-barrel protein [Saprospiraceae bacterium]
MRFTLLLLSIFTFSIAATAQEATPSTYTVSGQLQGENDEISFANVLLMNAADSVLAKAELSEEDGSFSMSADSGSYFLQVVMLGYSDFQSEAFVLGADKNMGALQLNAFSQTLETAVVTSKKPFLEQQAGKMIVNVEGSVTGQTGSATQLLQKVPGLVVRQGNVSMAGTQGVSILIDGRQTRYMDVQSLLRDLPASDIAKIEVITQPGASYDAEGGGVINIILKKNVRLGTNGSARLGVGRGTYDKFNTGVNLSHRDGPLNVFGSVNYRRGSGFDQLTLDREVEGALLQQDNLEPFLPNTLSFRGGVDYDITDRHNVGVSGRYRNTVDNATGVNSTQGYGGAVLGDDLSNAPLLFDLATSNINNQTRTSFGADVFYRFDIDTAGRKLEVDASYGGFNRDGELNTITNIVSGDFGSPIEDIRNLELGSTSVIAIETDYTHPIFQDSTRGLTLRTGAKYSYADVDADLRASSRPMNSDINFVNAPGLTNQFLYQENIGAAYLTFDAKLGDVKMSAGLRYEHTFIEGENVTTDSLFQRDYGNFFPSFGLSMPIAGPIGISTAYSYRLKRPSYGALNPFVRYMDPLTFRRGNTQLQPEFVHNAQINLSFEGQPFFRLAYTRTNDAISLVTEQDRVTKITEAYDDNLDVNTSYGGHLFAPLSFIPKVDGYFGGMAYYNRFETEFLGEDFERGSWELTGIFNATIELPLELKGELNYWIQSGGQQGIISSGTLFGSSIGLERKFLDKKLTVGISYEDGLFNPWDGEIRYQSQRMDIINTWETDIVMLNLTYKFGNRYMKSKERRQSAARDILNRAED